MSLGVVFITVPNATVRHFSGRTYLADANKVKIPFADADGIHGQGQQLAYSGLTADRPVPDGRLSWPPAQFYDETLVKPIFYVAGSNPARWVDINGTAV
jgi:hypothetical protein